MLVISRKEGESVLIGGNVLVKVLRTANGAIKLGFDAPAEVRVLRAECSIDGQPKDAAKSDNP